VNVDRGFLFWGVALITAGAVTLGLQSGAIPADVADDAGRWWPVILIVIGLAVIATRTPFAALAFVLAGLVVGAIGGIAVAGGGFSFAGCDDDELTGSVSEAGTFTDSADVALDFSCGTLQVGSIAGAEWRLTARHGDGDPPQVTAGDESLTVDADPDGGFGFVGQQQQWALVLPTSVELSLSVDASTASSDLVLDGGRFSDLTLDANAGDVKLDLRAAEVADLEIDANAGSIQVVVDGDSRVQGEISANAGSLQLCAPDDLALAITVEENVTFDHNLDAAGLDRSGDTWRRGDGDAAVVLSVSGNAGSFSLDAMEDCE